jgi:hypothetical protein
MLKLTSPGVPATQVPKGITIGKTAGLYYIIDNHKN